MFDPLSDWQRVKNAVHLALRNFERLALRGGARRTICAVAAASLSGTFFLTHQTPCSFCLSDMLISIVYTTELYHLGRFKRLIVQDIQVRTGPLVASDEVEDMSGHTRPPVSHRQDRSCR